ncbi:TBC1 domain family member 30 [Cynoglossus semilaevis]|uniref:TBC1 domain family member 30 n=1 Tax=Cynoglossus semilaevis TaxID=244447 RepID=UPI000D631350|nr:TBC1 domain family member 30 [Cynoglossus semilaevis]
MSQLRINSNLLKVDMSDVLSRPGLHDNFCGCTPDPGSGSGGEFDGRTFCRTSIVDPLLVELYETCSRRTLDSWDSSTEASGSDAFLGRSGSGSGFLQELQLRNSRRLQVHFLRQKELEQLRSIVQEVKYRTNLQSLKLIRQLKRRDRLCHKLQKNYDVITACLQAVSPKRRVDTRLKFTIQPLLGKNGFTQWFDALKAVARLPTGIPKEWRRRVWLTLADQYLHSISIDWDKTLRFAFNERSNPDDDSLGIQIVKDLHRTGCSSYSGQEGEQDRVVLKRVLLAYARWNKNVGYCQGFNVLAALILEVTEGDESDALKLMIFLIDKVLPENYFANNLRALSVDMAVFRDLLRLKLPRLWQHLHQLQKAANREAGGSYEPPLTNVFTMQWFLTMFATCLPPPTVLKIWDSVFFEGSEILFRVALVIWERLGERVQFCPTADDFYSTMGHLTQEMLEQELVHPADLMQEVYSMAVFPFPQLAELREKYTYNITPFPTSVKSSPGGGRGSWDSDNDVDLDDEDTAVTALGCLGPLGGLLAPELQRYQKHLKDQQTEQGNFTELSPGAVGGAGGGGAKASVNSMMMERMSTDICALTEQYSRIKRRQQQQVMQLYVRTDKCPATRVLTSQLNPPSSIINHLLLGRRPRSRTSPFVPGPQSLDRSYRQQRGLNRTGSPWRTHVRIHRRNVGRAGAELVVRGSEEEEERRNQDGGVEDGEDKREAGEGDVNICSSPPGSNCGDVLEMEVKLDSLDLEDNQSSSSSPPPPPSPHLHHPQSSGCSSPPLLSSSSSIIPSSSSSSPATVSLPVDSSSSLTPGGVLQTSTSSPNPQIFSSSSSSSSSSSKPQQPLFSPFPSVKPPKRSAAARNLGLYGPTARTPAVHFPQLSRHLNNSVSTTRRR